MTAIPTYPGTCSGAVLENDTVLEGRPVCVGGVLRAATIITSAIDALSQSPEAILLQSTNNGVMEDAQVIELKQMFNTILGAQQEMQTHFRNVLQRIDAYGCRIVG